MHCAAVIFIRWRQQQLCDWYWHWHDKENAPSHDRNMRFQVEWRRMNIQSNEYFIYLSFDSLESLLGFGQFHLFFGDIFHWILLHCFSAFTSCSCFFSILFNFYRFTLALNNSTELNYTALNCTDSHTQHRIAQHSTAQMEWKFQVNVKINSTLK